MSDTASGSAVLTNEVGLHARPSVKLTQLAKSFGCAVEIALGPDGPWFDAKSPVKMMRVRAAKGSTLFIRATGEGAGKAVAAIVGLVEDRFGEDEPAGSATAHA